MSYATSTGKMHDIPNLQVDTGEPKWIKVSTGSEARTAIFEMQPSALWVTGISVNAPPRPGVNWPWDAAASLAWHIRGTSGKDIRGQKFLLKSLLNHWRTTLPPTLPVRGVVSDDSGIVFIETNY